MDLIKIFNRLEKLPKGKALFSKAVCLKAPYFATISPTFETLQHGLVKVSMPKRRSILNHLNTVHAIAMCNLAEIAGGIMTDVSVDKNARWIPAGMTVKYLKKATSDLYAIADGRQLDWTTRGELIVPVAIFDTDNIQVFSAEITMKISDKIKG